MALKYLFSAGNHSLCVDIAVFWLHPSDGADILVANGNHRLLCGVLVYTQDLQCYQDRLDMLVTNCDNYML